MSKKEIKIEIDSHLQFRNKSDIVLSVICTIFISLFLLALQAGIFGTIVGVITLAVFALFGAADFVSIGQSFGIFSGVLTFIILFIIWIINIIENSKK